MPRLSRFALPLICLSLAACDPAAVATAQVDRAEARAIASCERAVRAETGNSGAAHNPNIPVVEVNQYVIGVPGEQIPWTCFTDDNGRAQSLVKAR